MIVRNYRDVEAETYPGAPGATIRWVIGAPEGAPTFAMRVIELAPGASSAHHSHAWEHEVFVLSGKGTVWAASGETPICEGDAVFVPPNEEHEFKNGGVDPLRFICLIPLQD